MKSKSELSQEVIDRAIEKANQLPIKPLVIDGKPYYVIHPGNPRIEEVARELGKELYDTPLGKGILWPLSEASE